MFFNADCLMSCVFCSDKLLQTQHAKSTSEAPFAKKMRADGFYRGQ